jgi:hypothetical protein
LRQNGCAEVVEQLLPAQVEAGDRRRGVGAQFVDDAR